MSEPRDRRLTRGLFIGVVAIVLSLLAHLWAHGEFRPTISTFLVSASILWVAVFISAKPWKFHWLSALFLVAEFGLHKSISSVTAMGSMPISDTMPAMDHLQAVGSVGTTGSDHAALQMLLLHTLVAVTTAFFLANLDQVSARLLAHYLLKLIRRHERPLFVERLAVVRVCSTARFIDLRSSFVANPLRGPPSWLIS